MTVREVRLYGDPVLTTRAEEITEFGPSLERLAQDMLETMEDAGGVGLAANQIGVTKRIFVFDCSHFQSGLRGAVINPEWEAVGEEMQLGTEGCLSIPGISQPTERFSTVRLRATTRRAGLYRCWLRGLWRVAYSTKQITWMVSCSSSA